MRAPGTYPPRLVKPLYSPQSRSLSVVHDLSNICSGNLFWNSELCCDRYQVKTSELGTSVASIPWEDQQILQGDVTMAGVYFGLDLKKSNASTFYDECHGECEPHEVFSGH